MWPHRMVRGLASAGAQCSYHGRLRLGGLRWCSTTPAAPTTPLSPSPAQPADGDAAGDDVVTPWNVAAKGPKGIDYQRVVSQFKSELIDAALLDRLAKVVAHRHAHLGRPGPPPALHPLLRRGMVFSHRDLHRILDAVEQQQSVYLYTGRGPSAHTMHIGHMVPFLLTKYLQDALGCPLVIQITDDEKFLFRDVPLGATMDKMATSNIKDIIAFGFDPQRTFIFRNTAYMGEMYATVLEVQRCLTLNAAKHTFGFVDTDNIGKIAFPATQAAPSFCSAFRRVLPIKSHNLRCLIPCAIDQDPFFVLTRNISERIKRPKPALLHTKFLPALKGATHKMSSSAENNGVIAMTDDLKTIKQKLRKAFSGGCGTMDELRTKGADLDADVAFQIIHTFADDDAVVARVASQYKNGTMSSADVKNLAADVLWQDVLVGWQQRRAMVGDDQVQHYCAIRNILHV